MARPIDPDPRRALLDRLDEEAERGGGEERIQRQHEAGKLTARERIGLLLDAGTFVELDKFKTHQCTEFGLERQRVLGDAVVTGHGLVDGRPVFVFAQDFTVLGGSVSAAYAEKVCKLMDRAVKVGAPVVGLYDSGGARIQEGVAALAGYGDVFLRSALASGVVPQVSVIMGPCAGGAVFGPSLTDFVVMVKGTATLFVNGPDVIRAATGAEITKEELGGAAVHAEHSGVAQLVADGEEAALAAVRELLSFLPSSNVAELPVAACADDVNRRDDALVAMIPDDLREGYDMREVVRAVVDDRHLLEISAGFARNVVAGLARVEGSPVGIIANQPAVHGGALDSDAAVKAARFVRFCDAFELPILTFVDVPGFAAATAQEWGGLARHGAKLLYAFAEATVPKVTIVTRRAYGAAYDLMASKHLDADVSLAYASAEIVVTDPERAVDAIYRKELAGAADADGERQRLVREYRERFANPYRAAELGYVDEVIRPEDTRPRVARALRMLRTKAMKAPRRKHGNIPL